MALPGSQSLSLLHIRPGSMSLVHKLCRATPCLVHPSAVPINGLSDGTRGILFVWCSSKIHTARAAYLIDLSQHAQ